MKLLLKFTLLITACCTNAARHYTMVDDTELLVSHSENTVSLDGCSSKWPENLDKKSYSYATLKGNEFGVTTNGDITLNIANDDFASVRFTTPDNPDFSRRLNFIPAPNQYNKANFTTVSISSCAGNFSQSAACVKTIQSNQNIRITTNPDEQFIELYCLLEPNRQYYLNFVNKNDPYSDDPPECLDPDVLSCAVFFSEGAL